MISPIPEQRLVASMVNDVVNHGGLSHLALRMAHHAENVPLEELQPVALPLPSVPTLRCGQSFAPGVRVQHLHGLGTDLTRSGGLHGDPRLSHGS
ncbi:hypothetical protein D3C78_1716020 [compost metagenome]